MRIGFRVQLAVVVAALISLSFIPAALATNPPAAGFTGLCGAMDTTHPATVKHVMFILFENKPYSGVVGSSSAPYINNTLIPGCGLATNYHAFSHPSAPDYMALTSGTAQGLATSKDCLPAGCPQSQASIFSQVGGAGQEWRQYSEAMPGNCADKNFFDASYPNADGSTGEFYYVRHAPAPYYTSPPVPGECSTWDVPLGTSTSGNFLTALSPSTDALPTFSFVSPGGCNDMHDCSTAAGDAWLKQWIPLIQRSAAYQSGQLIVFITWDEGTGPDRANGETCWDTRHADSAAFPSCHVPTFVMSPYTTPGTTSGDYFNHLSLLGTAEDLLGLPRLPTTQGPTGLQSAFGL